MHARCDMCPSYSRVKSANVTKIVWCQVYCRLCSARSNASPSTHIYIMGIYDAIQMCLLLLWIYSRPTPRAPAGHVYARCIHFLCVPVIIHTHVTTHTKIYAGKNVFNLLWKSIFQWSLRVRMWAREDGKGYDDDDDGAVPYAHISS